MATVNGGISSEYLQAYDGYDQQAVGLGLATGVDPDGRATDTVYATPAYAKSKTQNLPIGLISKIVYSAYENDHNPEVLVMGYEPRYNTVIGYSLRYATPTIRRALLKFVLESNAARIQSNQPILLDYYAIKAAIPDSQYLVRRYKVIGVRVQETYNLNEWTRVATKQTPFDGYYRRFKQGAKG